MDHKTKQSSHSHEQQEEQEQQGEHPDARKVQATSQAADAAARRMAAGGAVEEDDGMIVEDSDAETQRLRGELCERVSRRQKAVSGAINKWQSILRHRKAEGTIKKGLSKDGIRERFSDAWAEYLTDAVFEAASGVAEAAELTPGLGQAISVAGKGASLVHDHEAAQQAEAEVNAVDQIIADATDRAESEAESAKKQIAVMFHVDVRALIEQPEYPVEQHAIIGKLDALLLQAMRESGTQNVNQQLDALKSRGNLDEEIDEAERAKRHRKGGE